MDKKELESRIQNIKYSDITSTVDILDFTDKHYISQAKNVAANIIKEALEGYEIVHKSFLSMVKCGDPNCDGDGTIAVQIDYNEWEPQQCQVCHELSSHKGGEG